jgi:drug/metabolite transporter (DMT)-like permease
MNSRDNEIVPKQEGSLWKGIVLGLLCQLAYLLFVRYLPESEVRTLGYMLYALVQFVYLVPLAVFFQRRKHGHTSNGLIIAGAFSLLVEAAWLGYAAVHGTLPSINPN